MFLNFPLKRGKNEKTLARRRRPPAFLQYSVMAGSVRQLMQPIRLQRLNQYSSRIPLPRVNNELGAYS